MKSTKINNIVNKEVALIYGVMIGDGCLSKVGDHHYFLEISGHINDDLPFLKIIKPKVEKIRGKKVRIAKRPSQGSSIIGFSDKKTFLFFKNLGFPVGKKGIALKIPDSFPARLYKYIVQGYFATDGCLVIANNNGISYPRLEFSSISKKLLNQILNYLNDSGMNGNLYISHNYHDSRCTLYRIQFNGKENLMKFIRKIGFINPKHSKKYEKWKKKYGDVGI